jgi:hypothetical protein
VEETTLAKHAAGWIYIEGDYSEVDREFKMLHNAPSPKGVKALETVLFLAYEAQKQNTHVLTGSLKSSTKRESEKRFREWEGTITAGGASKGINNPVDYAIYEKARGGPHDFQLVLDGFDFAWTVAVKEGMS